jgi:hypothetical protein
MQLRYKALLFLTSLHFVNAYPPPTDHPSSRGHPPPEGHPPAEGHSPCPGHPHCPDPFQGAPHSSIISTVTSNTASFAPSVTTSIETRFIPSVMTTTANNTVFSTVTELSYAPSPGFNSQPYFFNPNLIYIKYCNGPAAPDNAGCTGDCTIYTQECNSERCKIHASDTECIETNGKVLFRTCSMGFFKHWMKPFELMCTLVCQFHPGVTEDGRWIYNTRWTERIDVYPNPDGIWAEDLNGGQC